MCSCQAKCSKSRRELSVPTIQENNHLINILKYNYSVTIKIMKGRINLASIKNYLKILCTGLLWELSAKCFQEQRQKEVRGVQLKRNKSYSIYVTGLSNCRKYLAWNRKNAKSFITASSRGKIYKRIPIK